jgi:hypothetical protein
MRRCTLRTGLPGPCAFYLPIPEPLGSTTLVNQVIPSGGGPNGVKGPGGPPESRTYPSGRPVKRPAGGILQTTWNWPARQTMAKKLSNCVPVSCPTLCSWIWPCRMWMA